MPQPLHFGEKSGKIGQNLTPRNVARPPDPSPAQSLAIGSTARPFARIASPALTVARHTARHIARPFTCARPLAYLIAGQLTRSPNQSPAHNIAVRYWVTMGKKKPPRVGAIWFYLLAVDSGRQFDIGIDRVIN